MSYFKGAHGILLVYDVTDRETFENTRHWMQQISQHADSNVEVLLVGNKCDKDDRVVSEQEGAELAAHFGVPFVETSAKNNTNVEECYGALARATLKRWIEDNARANQTVLLQGAAEAKTGGCC